MTTPGKPSDGGDTIHVRLWKQLMSFGCNQAAVGLLRDVFDMLEVTDRVAAEGKEPPPFREGGMTPPANLRDDLMVMLNDSHGQHLKMWRDLYQNDRDQFLELAEEAVEEAGQRLLEVEPPDNEDDQEQTHVEISQDHGGQLLVGLDDLTVLLKRRARGRFGNDAHLLEQFDHVVAETYVTVKAEKEKRDDSATDTMIDEGDPNAD